ncbi:MAG: type IV pilus biogenesis/stability protein PilW [Pseudomonadota bacterium]
MLQSLLRSLVLLALALTAACTATTPADIEASGSVEQAVSRQTASSESRKRAKVHADLGMAYLQEGRYEVALDEARIALESESGYAPAHNLKALIYMALRKNELAEQSFQEALSQARGDPEINNDYGWFLCQTGRHRQALSHFRVAINNPLYQSPLKALTNAGLCALAAKDDKLAEEYLLRALRMDRAHAAAYYWLADIAYRGGRLADARQRLKDLHALASPNAQSAWLALRVERKLGDRDEEARFMGIMRRMFRDTEEYARMMRGEFE